MAQNHELLDSLLDGIVTTKDCVECGRCCTFHEEDMMDAPLFTADQRDQVTASDYGKNVSFTPKDSLWQVDLTPQPDGSYVCPILDPATRMCRAREVDNFHCRTWPFQITRDDAGETFVTLSLDCPAAAPRMGNPEVQARVRDIIIPYMMEAAASTPGLVEEHRPELVVISGVNIPLRPGIAQ